MREQKVQDDFVPRTAFLDVVFVSLAGHDDDDKGSLSKLNLNCPFKHITGGTFEIDTLPNMFHIP